MHLRELSLFLTLVLAACALPTDEGRAFRERLTTLPGQSARPLVDELGPGGDRNADGTMHYRWGVWVVSEHRRDCTIDVIADQSDRVTSANMTGSDLSCGLMLKDFRRTEARYRAHPGLREREEAENEARAQELARLRREVNSQPH